MNTIEAKTAELNNARRRELAITPDKRADFIKFLQSAKGNRLDLIRESLGKDDFDSLLTNAMNKVLIDSYSGVDTSDITGKLVSVMPSSTFLDITAIRMGRLQEIEDLADTGGIFHEIDMPKQDKITFSVAGKGNIFSVDFKTLTSDQLDYFGGISTEMGKATGWKFVRDFFVKKISDNPLTFDGNALFDNTIHFNDLSAGTTQTLTYASIFAGIEAFDKILDSNSLPVFMGDQSLWLVVGRTNRQKALKYVKSPGNPDTANVNDPNMLVDSIKGVIYCPLWTTQVALAIDKGAFKGHAMAFLDGYTKPVIIQEPESSHKFETNDTRWRIEWYYGSETLDPSFIIRLSQ